MIGIFEKSIKTNRTAIEIQSVAICLGQQQIFRQTNLRNQLHFSTTDGTAGDSKNIEENAV